MKVHFSGIAGAGINPMAQLMALQGHEVQGSDRAFDQGQAQDVKKILLERGITVLAQDGSAVYEGLDLFVYSTAVENKTPEMQACEQYGLKMLSRPQLLAQLINESAPGVAIAGTSGKSTVVGMIAWIAQCCKSEVTVLGGAALAEKGVSHMGCFALAESGNALIAEACESDGTLVGYRPHIALIHNITRDHSELDELQQQFSQFSANSACLLYNSCCEVSSKIARDHKNAQSYGLSDDADFRFELIRSGPYRGQAVLHFDEREYNIDVPQPGRHNLDNACAALAVCAQMGIDLEQASKAMAEFPGVARRYQIFGTTEDNIRVIDDYANNADKIRAVIEACQESCNRLIAIFQPHGFGPARFLRPELQELLPNLLRQQDVFCYAPIFYA
ncbi:MAG: hypothetical protein HRU15_10055, partial [Planctomycetes bacterium]|nr:hypothetical protein [Planctomycetota bacterium]